MRYKICRGRILFSVDLLLAFARACFKTKKQKECFITDFEQKFAAYIGCKHVIAVSSGKIALYLALKAFSAKAGDEIIVPAYTVPEVIDMIVLCGLSVIFVDINLDDANMDASLIEEKITERTKFILMTHMYGYPCRTEKIQSIAQQYGLTIIEDAAQACGAEYKGEKTGTFGEIGYFSFGMFKNLNTLGGGMLVTDDSGVASEVINLMADFSPAVRNPDLTKKAIIATFISMFTHPVLFSVFVYPLLWLLSYGKKDCVGNLFTAKAVDSGFLEKLKVRFAGKQAVIGLRQLADLDRLNEHKMNNADILNKGLDQLAEIEIIQQCKDVKNIYLNYVIRVDNRDKFKEYLFNRGIDLSEGAVICCADLEKFKNFYSLCPNSQTLEKENVYIPIYPPLNVRDMERFISIIKEYCESTR
ncbi:MAG: DegT/DnrJ/EryC1/StrS aminotransferase family protein [PVC group bacterium]|nr:DegT/DnrJ/EryC1/StrS aminotransferase family protein [PVC group bacterium]